MIRCCLYRELIKRMQYSRQNTFMVLATGQAKVKGERRGEEGDKGEERKRDEMGGEEMRWEEKRGDERRREEKRRAKE